MKRIYDGAGFEGVFVTGNEHDIVLKGVGIYTNRDYTIFRGQTEMDPAEEIVSLWLRQQRFFILQGVETEYRGKEIDFLAVDIANNRRVHVEVHASVPPLVP